MTESLIARLSVFAALHDIGKWIRGFALLAAWSLNPGPSQAHLIGTIGVLGRRIDTGGDADYE